MSKSLDGNLIKKAHAQIRYSLEEVNHLEACMDPVTGPLYFAKNFIKIQHPTRGSIPFEPYGFQELLIERIPHQQRMHSHAATSDGQNHMCSGISIVVYTVHARRTGIDCSTQIRRCSRHHGSL
jgi:hypothetical protein